jgi:GH24 family phage-related lysozyme (muramidase)
MFTGWQWVSDFRQRNMWPYGGDGICTIFRFNGTIDPSLGSLVGNFGAGFDQNGYLTVLEDKHFMLSTERKDQKDNQLMEDLSFIYKSILDHCVLDELYGERECILKEPKFGTKEKIEKATKKDEDEHVQYLNELTSDDSTISESIVEAMLLYISSASTGNSIQVMDPGQLQIMMSAMNVGESGLSDSMVKQISMYEANKPFGYAMTDKDLNGYNAGDNQRTYGYGLVYYPGGKYKMSQIKTKWTQKDLESTYLAALKERTNKVLKWATKNKLVLNQHQIDALVCIHYNINGFFTDNRYSKLRQMIINDPKDQNIKNEWAHLSDWQTKFPGLKKRRALEAEWFMA